MASLRRKQGKLGWLLCLAWSWSLGRGAKTDRFDEAVRLHVLPPTRFPHAQMFLAQFEFRIEAESTAELRADNFDLIPKPIGKLLNGLPAIASFEVTLTQGRWKAEDWGLAPDDVRPPGATVVLSTNSTDDQETLSAFKFLVHSLSGSLCASLQGADPDHGSSSWLRPLGMPWTAAGHQARFATLPYEPVCTENLTPWLKMLPCGHKRGLASLFAPLAHANAPFVSLGLSAAAGASSGMALRATLDVVLPLQAKGAGFQPFFAEATADFHRCPAATTSSVLFTAAAGNEDIGALGLDAKDIWRTPDGLQAVDAAAFARFENSTALPFARPGRRVGDTASEEGALTVMRDVLSLSGRSERTHGRYLLRVTNSGQKRRMLFMDPLPFFIRPLWHTFQAKVDGLDGSSKELHGLEAMTFLGLQFVPSDAQKSSTELFLSLDIPAGAVISASLEVLKSFVPMSSFTYSCEKGFDVGSAAWLEKEMDGDETASDAPVSIADMRKLLVSRNRFGSHKLKGWRLRFTEGLLLLVPMPDFSMPFNVIALSSTAATFLLASVAKMTADRRLPHWVLLKDEATVRGKAFWIKRCVLVALVAGLYNLAITEMEQVQELREQLPEAVAGPIVDALEAVKVNVLSQLM